MRIQSLVAFVFVGFWVVAIFTMDAFAANATFVPGSVSGSSVLAGLIEVQGSSGRITVPLTFQTGTVNSSQSLNVVGATSTDSTTYTLLTSSTPSVNSVLLLNDPHTGVSLGTIQLDARLGDIAYTNGQLYGIGSNSTALQIATISADGTTHNVFNQPVSSSTAIWRLSGVGNGSGLLAGRGSFSSGTLQGSLIDPTSFSVSAITLAGQGSNQLKDMVINAAGSMVASVAVGTQTLTSFPSGASLGPIAGSAQYRTETFSNAVSDEFNYNYLPTLPGAASISWNATSTPLVGLNDGLTRTPQVFSASGPFMIKNYVAPDATVLSNVTVSNQITQASGPTPFVISVQNSAPGDLSNRVVGRGTATLDLATAQRGFYQVLGSASVTADYSYGTTVDHGRPVQSSGGSLFQFAYEPISSNLVGNGDAALGNAGWDGSLGGLFFPQLVTPNLRDHSFILSSGSSPIAMRQSLQLPTPNSAMQLSFTYNLTAPPSGTTNEIQVFLNSILVADVLPTSTSVQTFQTTIDNPSLENLANPILLFQDSSSFGGQVEVGNISLSAVPEPMMSSLLLLAVGAQCLRRLRRA
ncbi:MAG TPA: hypothetical protein VHS31_06150 [Tepidisphaeraceae bacterium]|jgi:hypothetical protein|nr:hypothetical protein [Tepidisphaeraceae bacterium]